RGSDAAHSEYYIDGHDISSSMDCLPGMTLDPVLFGALEISRGGGSGFLRGGMTGTLNFIPESSGLPPRASLIAGDDESISLSAGFTKGINRITLSIRKLKGTAGSTACNGAFLVNGNTQPFSYGILAAFSAGETESPEWALPADGERKRYSFDGWGRWSPGRLRLSLGIRTGRHEYFSTQPSLVDDRHDEFSGDLSLEYNVPLLKFQLGLSALSSLDRILSTSIGERERLTGEAALTVGYADGISVSASSSLNMVSSERSMYGAALSIGLPVLDSLLLLHTSASTGFRRPSLNDLYWPEDNFALGNPDLLPETSREIESGISFSAFEYFSFSATAFIAETEDMIRWEPAESGKWSPLNISRALRKGIEMQLWFSDTPIELTGTLTLLEVTDNFIESVNYCRTLPYTPDYTFGVQAGLEYPRRIHWSVSASGMGIRFKNYSETSWMPAYTIFTAGVYLFPKIMGSFSLNASMENIFDQDYQETSGYSGKPRTLHFGIEWNGN
ncbi:MAG: TonB-dependent receptor, partial [Candidatus Fermentibacteria bacterium]